MKELDQFIENAFSKIKVSSKSKLAKAHLKTRLQREILSWFKDELDIHQMLIGDMNYMISTKLGYSQEATMEFDDLFKLDNPTLQMILASVYNNNTIVLAICDLTTEESNRFLFNIPMRRRELLDDQIKDVAKSDPKRIIAAREEIVKVALKLQKEEKIYIKE